MVPSPTHHHPLNSRLTLQQGQAVTRREVSVVLSSGAGCGKTHVLTERYLSHLREDGAEVSQIVAITFTDRAARQMRERIRKAVGQELQRSTAGEVERWIGHLRGLETAQISTIHAFCASLLRQNAVEAGLDPRFEVLEEVLSTNLQDEALTSCLQDLLIARTQPGADLKELILLYGWRPVVEAVRHLLDESDVAAWQDWSSRPAEALACEWEGARRAELLPRYVEYLVAACPKIARCLWLLRTTPCIGPITRGNVGRLLSETPALAGSTNLDATVRELVDAAKVGKERGKAWQTEEDYQAVKNAFEGFREELPKQLALFTEPVTDLTQAVTTGQQFLHVAGEVVRVYTQLKRRDGVLDFQDLLTLARNLLREHPQVREQLQRRFQFILIDELQDTDPVQMELVELLCGGGLTAGKLFAVGDVKQSIYRFRGADVRQLQNLRASMPHDGRLGLTVNFRSQPAILHFANALFGSRMPDYEPLHAHLSQVNPEPCVEFLWSPRQDRENVSESRSREADWIARRLACVVAEQATLVAERPDHPGAEARLRPVKPGDIVLLFRSMSNVQLYEQALRNHGLDYYLVGGRAFFAQQEIYDLLNLLRALENAQDRLSVAGTLRSPFCCLSDEALFVLSRHGDGLWAGLHDPATCTRLPSDQRSAADRARDNLDRWHSLKDRLPIARLLGEVLADSGYDAALRLESLGERKLANLWKLIELARAFDRSGLFGLAQFIARLGDLVRSQPREEQAATQPENADVVRLMTIHQAKGLEFPVVVVPDLAASTSGPRPPVAHWDRRLGCIVRPPPDEEDDEQQTISRFGHQLWKASEAVDDWQEDLRTLYVACTRAQDYLMLSAALPESFSPANSWMLTLAERFDLASGACLVTDLLAEEIPRVRVTSSLPEAKCLTTEAALLPAAADAELVDQAPAEEKFTVSERDRSWPAEVAPVPVRLRGMRVIRVAEIAAALQRPRPGERPLRSSSFGFQFDAEDGSDRSSWQTAREFFVGSQVPGEAARQRILHSVLAHWDFQDPNTWRPLLAGSLQLESGPQTEIERWLAGFAASEVFQELAAARQVFRDLEFVAQLEPESASADGQRLPAVAGVCDSVWQGADGEWHLLALMAEGPLPNQRDPLWGGRKIGLVLAAYALEQQGKTPKSLALYHLETGTCLRGDGSPARQRKLLVTIRDALSDLVRRTLPD